MSTDPDRQIARQGRQAALAIAGGGLLAILAPVITRLAGLAPRFEMLFYLAAMGAFIWALVVTYGIWQKTRNR
ncbi:DUF5337 domain-containing protein [Roseisalinus antarcticus]|uniref:Uncharacterized protein n=1 Tax=Roseisalinus antarcticus TaxID=254357 RepID=A0A1Y5SJ10_9RHOB|nr:DUF5337 domain-containing protein [Roseisalinus antarcticus]SLN41264.1 hypothetical protein ROA7023_01643 [Roseisalinus antarcticus]